MKYTPPFRIVNGSIYEYRDNDKCYMHIYKKTQLTKEEIRDIQRQNAIYEAKYNNWEKNNK